jgi:AraC-like DNA-binding protein
MRNSKANSMALIIHKVLFGKLSQLPDWGEFKRTFRELCGCEVELQERPSVEGKDGPMSEIDVRGILVGVLLVRDEASLQVSRSACQQLLNLAAERFASLLAARHVHDHEQLPAAVLKTCQWIRAHALLEDIRLEAAAEACGLSAGHLSRLFHQSTGLTFQEYVRRFRLERACELLQTSDQSITAIAFESGFQSISQFHRSFKSVYGQTPSAYRKQHA